jgi:retron-type reverse transcriptase
MNNILLGHKYEDIISMENLLEAWKEFLSGKKSRQDVQEFQRHLMSNILLLHRELKDKTYKHSSYEVFNISDPKPRIIHKAKVRDRLLHHAIYRVLYPFFERTFITDSFSCRINKGTHKALERFKTFARKESRNHTKTVWVLKCDIRKFFASVDQKILLEILNQYIPDKEIISLLSEIIGSFYLTKEGIGLPLGNLTSQLLVNIYMNEFDQYVKHRLKAKYYIRYADDFVIFSQDKECLIGLINEIRFFLDERLHLYLHPNKVSIKTVASGADYLGWVNFNDHRTLRTAAKKKMFRKLAENPKEEVLTSYLGMLSHGNARKLSKKVDYFYNLS